MTNPSREAFERTYPAAAADWHEGIQNYVAFAAHYEGWQAAMTHKEADAWQPINTAPQDGTTLLLRSAKGRIASGDFGQPIGWANPKCWIWPYLNQEPTHWQPLPAAPLPQGE